ncbi:CynX/NimT family MFS transporter [Haladaptatus sp. R4]|uniref:MFS transporter n=1 Tax=Haladaptatus sp. R4 TaxID=1679489 RepID=UPI0009EDC4F2|nr:MFS transporter [Haladaptatus sp. R4]
MNSQTDDSDSAWVFSSISLDQVNTKRHIFVLLGLLVVALNLRPAIASVSPVLEQIRIDLGLSYGTVSLLTTLPTICMGVFALTAAPIAQRLGQEQTVLYAVILIGFATAVRFAGTHVSVLFATAIVVGIGIALIQALLPALVDRYFTDRADLVTSLYTASLIGGAAIAAAATVPIERMLGSWSAALGSWSVLAVFGAIFWGIVIRGQSTTANRSGADGTVEGEAAATQLPWRSRWAWILSVFYGGSAFLYFATLTWLAPFYQSLGWSEELSGFLLTVFTVAEIAGTLGVALLTSLSSDRRPALVLTLVACIIGFGAMAWIPLASPWIWATIAGAGIGGLFDLTLLLPIDYAPTPETTGKLSSMVVGIGYLLSALGPVVIGRLRSASDGYVVPFLLLVGICVIMLIVSLWFQPENTIKVR